MSAARGAWVVATTVGVVEALKDQGCCRLSNGMRSIHQHGKNQLRYATQAKKLPATSSSVISKKPRDEKMKKSEESLRTVMYLSCWGPNS